MPYRSSTGGFTGNTNMATFIDQVVVPFMTDAKGSGGLGWSSQTPSRGKGTTPNFEFLISRDGPSPTGPPFWFCQTTAKTLFIYSGYDVNTAQESFDQPGNPINGPDADPPTDPATSHGLLRCHALTTVVGSYDSYWVFGGDTGQYCHVVLKVGARQYRHFHVGLLDPLNSDFPADAHYLTSHRWGRLDPDRLVGPSSNQQWDEHRPYDKGHHILPFRNDDNANRSFTGGWAGDIRSCGMWVHVPGGHGTLGYPWWFMVGVTQTVDNDDGGTEGRAEQGSGNFGTLTSVTKPVGDVNTASNSSPVPDIYPFGAGWVSGYDESLGTVPFCCEPTFTTDGIALVPIIVCLPSDFDSALRWAPVAQVPDVFRVNMKSLNAEEEITVGSDTYTVFPLMNNDANNTLEFEGYSGYEGLAYKKITANAT